MWIFVSIKCPLHFLASIILDSSWLIPALVLVLEMKQSPCPKSVFVFIQESLNFVHIPFLFLKYSKPFIELCFDVILDGTFELFYKFICRLIIVIKILQVLDKRMHVLIDNWRVEDILKDWMWQIFLCFINFYFALHEDLVEICCADCC